MHSILFGEEPIETVYQLATRAGVRPSIENPLLYQSVNIEGTSTLLEAMRESGCRRLVFASSSSIYGSSTTMPLRETDRVDAAISPYAATKKSGELICHVYHHRFGFEIACLRFFTAYGPRQRPEMAIHKFTRCIDKGEEVTMFGDGTSSRDYTYIDDIIQGILAIEKNFSGYRILNIGESATTTLRELITLIASSLGTEARLRTMPMQPGDVMTTCADIDAARSLGYAPATPIASGIAKFVTWYRQQQPAPAPAAIRQDS